MSGTCDGLLRTIALGALAALLVASGCRSNSEQASSVAGEPTTAEESSTSTSAESSTELPDVLVTSEWLATRLAEGTEAAKVVVLDARTPEEYRAGHVPGARSLPYIETFDTRAGKEQNVASIRAINGLFSRVGVAIDRPVIIYGSDDYRAAARLFWVLETHGHPAAAVLDGGVEAWQASGRSLSTQVPEWTPTHFVASFDAERHADKLEVLRALKDPDIEVVDSRAREEYLGEQSKGARNGHITTATHIDSQEGLATEDGVCSVRERETLAARFRPLARDKTIYTYCNTGRRAAVNYLLLRSLGYRVAVYDGSWMEWSADVEMPITSGSEPGEVTSIEDH